jgi:hypothetical protein
MTDDARMTWGFILDVLNVLEQHGYHRSDNPHTGEAVGLIWDLARVYDGTLDTRASDYVAIPSPQQPAARPLGRADQDAVVVSAAEARTIMAALDVASDYKRDRTGACAECADQSCLSCQTRIRDADAYDRVTAQLLETAATSRSAAASPPEPDRTSDTSAQPHATDKEAGQ